MERAAPLRGELAYAREQTDELFRLISPEALYERPIAERHRLVFYLGHFDAFDWNLLARRSLSGSAFHPEFDKLFERGIDPPAGQTPHEHFSRCQRVSARRRPAHGHRGAVDRP